VDALLKEAIERRWARLPPETNCFRWIDGELPGVTVDLFGDVAVLSFYRPAARDEARGIGDALMSTHAVRSIFVKHRPREAKRAANEELSVLAPPEPLVGEPVSELDVAEHGVRFVIRPGNGLSVGLYLDARDARRWVKEHSRGRRVLNLFSYTCGFGVVATVGGASRAANVDVSRKVLDWGEENLEKNGLTPKRFDFIAGDSFDWLARFAKKREQFDLVVLDPPGFATTKTSRFTAARDYHQLVEAAQKVVAPRGLLLSMCNVEALSFGEFDAQLERALGLRKRRRVKAFGASEVDFNQPSALKCVVYELLD
jgi:23S rRNA (cytosine1962-C5)-methyltransferase